MIDIINIITTITILLLLFYFFKLKFNTFSEGFDNLHRSKIEQHYRFTLDDYPYGFATHPPTDYAIRREKLRNKILDKYNEYIKLNLFDKKASVQYPCRPSITKEYIDCGPYSYNICKLP